MLEQTLASRHLNNSMGLQVQTSSEQEKIAVVNEIRNWAIEDCREERWKGRKVTMDWLSYDWYRVDQTTFSNNKVHWLLYHTNHAKISMSTGQGHRLNKDTTHQLSQLWNCSEEAASKLKNRAVLMGNKDIVDQPLNQWLLMITFNIKPPKKDENRSQNWPCSRPRLVKTNWILSMDNINKNKLTALWLNKIKWSRYNRIE